MIYIKLYIIIQKLMFVYGPFSSTFGIGIPPSTKNIYGDGSPSNTDGGSSDPFSPTDTGSSSTDNTFLSGGDENSLPNKSCTKLMETL